VTAAQAAATAAGIAGGGLVAVAPSSIANSGGSASTTGNTTTFTGVTALSLNGCFTSDYSNYFIILQNSSPSTPVFTYRMRASNTDNTSSEYDQQRTQFSGTSQAGTQDSNGTSFGGWSLGTSAGRQLLNLTLTNPQVAEFTLGSFDWVRVNLSNTEYCVGSVVHTTATQFDGISFIVASSTMTGTIRVYGYKD
jgi:hypothetical protein